jgi:virulence factor Mce-like protein
MSKAWDTLRAWVRGREREPSRLRVGVTAVIVLAVVLTVVVGLNSLHLSEDTYRAEFVQAAGVAAGDPVTDAGIPVGTVTGTRLAGDRVVVTLKIKHSVAMGTDTRAAIKLTTLLGSRYVELRPRGTGALRDHLIPLAQTEVPYDLEAALQDATTTFSEIDADQIATSMSTLSAQLRGTPALVPQVLDNMRTLASVIAQRRAQLGKLLESASQVTTVIRGQQADLATLVNQGRTVLEQIISRQQAITRLLDAITTLVHQLAPIVVDDQPEIQRLLTNLDSMTGMITSHDDLMRSILQVLPVPWRLFANATGTGEELVGNAPDGVFVDSYMCALSKRAIELHQQPYLKDCK